MHLYQRSTTIECALRAQALAPLIPFAAYMDLWEIRGDVMSVPHIHAGAKVDGNVRCDIQRDVTRCSLEIRIAPLAARVDQLYRDPTSPGFRSSRRHAVEFNAPTACFCVNVPFGRRQANRTTAGLNHCRPADVTEVYAAAARGYLDLAGTLSNLNSTATGFDDRFLRS